MTQISLLILILLGFPMLLEVNALPLMPVESALVNFIQGSLPEQIALLEQLVNINSGTENPSGVRKVGELLRSQFEALGFSVRWHELPENMYHTGSLVATLRGSTGKRLLLVGHLDTVFPAESDFQRFAYAADRKMASGPGVIDDKGGIVAILFALKALHHVGGLKDAYITVVLTGDEELAAKPIEISRKVLIDAAKESDIALGFEFALSADELVVGRRGLSEWFLTSSGRSGHSSAIFKPNLGFGAIFEISRVLHEIGEALSTTPGLTINPGLLLGGQQATEDIEKGSGSSVGRKTVVAAQAIAHGDLRFLTNQQRDHAEQIMINRAKNALPGTTSTVKWRHIMPVMEATQKNYRLLEQYSLVSEKLGGPTLRAARPEDRGGADLSYSAGYVPASLDGLGPWGTGAHSTTETIDLDSLPVVTQRAALFIWQQLHSMGQPLATLP